MSWMNQAAGPSALIRRETVHDRWNGSFLFGHDDDDGVHACVCSRGHSVSPCFYVDLAVACVGVDGLFAWPEVEAAK